MNKTNLYFIALVPHPELRERVKQLKEEMKERFNAKHALKSPAHITLQMPFKRTENEETRIIDALTAFAVDQKAFQLELNDFGCFYLRVIYLNVVDHEPVALLQRELMEVLHTNLNFNEDELLQKFSPHMTIATRDLDKTMFQKAWSEFKDRRFNAPFKVKSIFLLKHNGKFWNIYREMSFDPKKE